MEMTVLADLLDLQEVDLEIDRLLEQRRTLPELEQYREANARRLAMEAEHEEVAGELRELELEVDKAEGELDILEARLGEAETRLFAGGMSARETEHKRLEVRSLKAQQEAMEERIIGLLDRVEALRTRLTEARSRLEAARRQEAALEEAIGSAWGEIDARLARQEAQRVEMVPGLPGELLELYDRLRQGKEGVAVGRLEDGQCGGCHLHLSPAEQVEARESDPPRCVHCRRILVM